MNTPSIRRKPGVTLIEVAVSTALVGLVLVAALETLGGAMRTMRQTSEGLKGQALAAALLAEVTALPYSDPTDDASKIGLDPSDAFSGDNRLHCDDLDDFHGWNASPPVDRFGVALPGYDGWDRLVEVTYLNATPSGGGLSTGTRDQGLKRVRVAVTDPDGTITEVFTVRSPYGPNEAPAPYDAERVASVEATLAVGDGTAVRKNAVFTNLAEAPQP